VVWRGLPAAAAVVVVAWLALSLQGANLSERGTDELLKGFAMRASKPAKARRYAQAAQDLDRSTFLNPDRLPRIYRAQALAALGERGRARQLVGEVTREEPRNREIWDSARATALVLGDRALEAEARRRLRELNPNGLAR
jgi:predicted Zn-dependent protease